MTCPRGHVVLLSQVETNHLGQRVCPACERERPWAARSPRLWSRTALKVPLLVLAAALAAAVIGDVFFIASDASVASANYPGSTADLIGRIFALVSDTTVAAAVVLIALLVARPGRGQDDTPA